MQRRILFVCLILGCSAGGGSDDDTDSCNVDGTFTVRVELVRDELGPITPIDQRCLDAIAASNAPAIDEQSVEALCPWVRSSATCPFGGESPATIVSANGCSVRACYGDAIDRNLAADGYQGTDCGVAFDCREQPCVGERRTRQVMIPAVQSLPGSPSQPPTTVECEYAVTLVRDP